ncbi:MAG: MGMT family protein [Candidatus Phosphoribacter sp.]|nr:MGMT family protein [Actinomycetales bacterium]
MDALPEHAELVLELVEQIPPGQVATYGDLARWVGSGGPRQAGQVMSRYGSDVPWWRVVRAGGLPPRGLGAAAAEHYRDENTPLIGMPSGDVRVDLVRARWPGPHGRPEVASV